MRTQELCIGAIEREKEWGCVFDNLTCETPRKYKQCPKYKEHFLCIEKVVLRHSVPRRLSSEDYTI